MAQRASLKDREAFLKTLSLRFTYCLAQTVHAVCEGLEMLPPQEKGPMTEKLATIQGKMRRPVDNADDGTAMFSLNELLTIGAEAKGLARDVAEALENADQATIVVQLQESEARLGLCLDDMRGWRESHE